MSDMGHENSLTAGEEHVLVLRPHWKPLVWPVVAVLIVAEVPIPSGKAPARSAWYGSRGDPAANVVADVFAVKLAHQMYELKTRRMRIRAGIISRIAGTPRSP
jgi:hypothetical protein